MYLEDDDTRDVGVIMTYRSFSLFSGSLCGEKNAAGLVRHRAGYFRLLAVAVFSALSFCL